MFYLHTYWLTVYIKRPGLDKVYQTTSTTFFSNSRSLERPGLIIEILEYTSSTKGSKPFKIRTSISLAESFYSVKYGALIITSEVSQKISVMKT